MNPLKEIDPPPQNAHLDTHILKVTVGGSTDPLKPIRRCPLRNKVFLKSL